MVLLDEVKTEQHELIRSYFAQGEAWGILRLATLELGAPLSRGLAALRAIGCSYLERLCVGRRRHRRTRLELDPSLAPDLGLPEAVVRRFWTDLGATLELELRARGENVDDWIRRAAPQWDEVGRVVYHLSERAETPARATGGSTAVTRPFRFFASFVLRVGTTPRTRLVPLARALHEASRNARFVGLMGPVMWAAERNAIAAYLFDGNRVLDAHDWTPDEALEFVEAIPVFQRAGILVRAPAFKPRATRDAVSVAFRIGERASVLTQSALLDFSVEVALGGERLSEAELRQILATKARLVPVRGRWVAIDQRDLAARIARWKDVSEVTVAEGLRLLSGLDDEPPVAPFVAGEGLRAALEKLGSPDPAEADPGPALGTTLREYQKMGVAWLWQLQKLGVGGCLADDMGLGKTVQVLALLLVMKARGLGPTLLVAPASLIANWRAEAARFAPSLRIAIAHASAHPSERFRSREATDADLVITTYGSLRRQTFVTQTSGARRWRLVVLDEAQAIKNPTSRQARAVKEVASDTRLALTGTPVENSLGDLWSIFDFVNPGLLGSRREFAELCTTLASRAPDALEATRYEPLRRLLRPYILRRAKTDRSLLPELPDKTELKAWCTLTRTQAALYQQEVERLARGLDDPSRTAIARRGLVLSALVRLKQICNHPSQWLGDGLYDPAASGKLARMREICGPVAAAGEKVLVFTQFREMTEPLADFLASLFGRRGLILTGETDIAKRRELVDAFQAPDGPPFFVLSLRAGGTGLTLTAASHVIHFDRWWNPAVENQATDRAYRIGQKKNVLVHKLVCRGTVEERVDELIESKRSLATSVIESGGELLLTELGRDELLSLVSLDRRTALDGGG